MTTPTNPTPPPVAPGFTPVPEADWRWTGVAGHFILGYRCRWHLCTDVGDICVSSVGEMPDPIKTDGKELGRFLGREHMETFGSSRDGCFYETMVFPLGSEVCTDPECACGYRLVSDWQGITSRRWKTRAEAQRGHEDLCERAARGEFNQAAARGAQEGA